MLEAQIYEKDRDEIKALAAPTIRKDFVYPSSSDSLS